MRLQQQADQWSQVWRDSGPLNLDSLLDQVAGAIHLPSQAVVLYLPEGYAVTLRQFKEACHRYHAKKAMGV